MMMLWNPLDPARGPPPYRLADEPGSATGQDDRGDLDQIGEDQNIIEQMLLAEVGEDAAMARTLQVAALPRVEARQLPAGATLAALGIVYGDIGTSALYGFKQAADAAGAISPETIMGIVSVILWSLVLIVSFKYAILIMRADNRGEGGIIALLALLDVR